MYVYNHDVAGLYRRINRFIEELIFSQSSSGSEMIVFDQVRLSSYLGAIRSYHAWIVNQPLLDLPETSPRQYDLEPCPAVPSLENESIRDLIVLLELGRDELINGQSARLSSNVTRFDSTRLLAIVEKAQAFLDCYISTVTPLDLPESSPMREITGSGKQGV